MRQVCFCYDRRDSAGEKRGFYARSSCADASRLRLSEPVRRTGRAVCYLPLDRFHAFLKGAVFLCASAFSSRGGWQGTDGGGLCGGGVSFFGENVPPAA